MVVGFFCGGYLFYLKSGQSTGTKTTDQSVVTQERRFVAGGVSVVVPIGWEASEKDFDGVTIELSKSEEEGVHATGLYIGSPFIFSTSGAINGNEPYFQKVDELSSFVGGKRYVADIYALRKFIDGKISNEMYYRFQVELGEGFDNKTITGQMQSLADKSVMEVVLSSLKRQ